MYSCVNYNDTNTNTSGDNGGGVFSRSGGWGDGAFTMYGGWIFDNTAEGDIDDFHLDSGNFLDNIFDSSLGGIGIAPTH